ncbi:hypothetical protein [Streptomyces erythrochromogenes]|uniref:hypothetical protein n=1 Tax=Streptomyces erythrochromogenes TaxID=285574 RepID=UPI0037D6E7E4
MSHNTILTSPTLSEQATRPDPAITRLRIAVGRKAGTGPLILEQSEMSAADKAAHAAASYIRRPVTT